MKNSKAVSSFKRLACAFLAFVTFVVAIPFVGIEADAIDATTYNEAYFDFQCVWYLLSKSRQLDIL